MSAINAPANATTNACTDITTPSKLSESFMNNLMLNKFSDVLSNKFDFTVSNLLKFFFLLFILEIKSFAPQCLKWVVAYIHASGISRLIPMLRKKFSKKIVTVEEDMYCEEVIDTAIYITIDADFSFLFALYKYIHANDAVTFTDTSKSILISNSKDKIYTESISDIIINSEGIIEIMNPIFYNIDISTDEPTSATIGKVDKGPKVYTSYLDLFSTEQRSVLITLYNILNKKYGMSTIKDRMRAAVIDKKCICEFTLANEIAKKYPDFAVDEMTIIIGIICSICNGPLTCAMKRLQATGCLIFDPHNVYNYNEISKNGSTLWRYFYNNFPLNYTKNYQPEYIGKLFADFTSSTSILPNNSLPNDKLNVKITNVNKNNVKNNLCKLVETIYKHGKKSTESVKIHHLSLEYNIETKEEANPEYDAWLEKKQIIDEMMKTTDEKHFDPTTLVIPPKTIKTEIKTKVPSLKLLNTINKNIDTLYLRQADRNKLLNSLSFFKNKKDIVKELGLPNKLNILLYGLPGTGKSTAIQAIATYLGRDIYYLDLKNAHTNQDLQQMFEHVNKKVAGDGIIVMEDIDAMIDIVLKRAEEPSEYKVNDLISGKNNKLSLEYLLNILQGTLTMDNSMFIVTTNHIDHLDPAFYRDGRFDVRVEFRLCDHYQIRAIYKKFMNSNISEELLERIPENKFSPATVIFHIKDYIFDDGVSDEVVLAKFIS